MESPEPFLATRKGPAVLIAALAVMMAALAIGAWGATFLSARQIQPISISTCRADVLDECVRFGDVGVEVVDLDDAVVVYGETCNDDDDEHAYTIDIGWTNVETGAYFGLLNAPISWPPGCTPYEFPFEVPDQLKTVIAPGESAGLWALTGTAEPLDNEQLRSFSWNITGAVELVRN